MIILTGFGPFGHHQINSSSEIVFEVKRTWPHLNISLEALQIPVSYEAVNLILPTIYNENNFELCVHFGVSNYTNLTLEVKAHNAGYNYPDVDGQLPYNRKCENDGAEVLETIFDLKKIANSCMKKYPIVNIDVSENAGRYLCEFIYYKSLSIAAKKNIPVLFVHVPEITANSYSLEQLATASKNLIEVLMEQIYPNFINY